MRCWKCGKGMVERLPKMWWCSDCNLGYDNSEKKPAFMAHWIATVFGNGKYGFPWDVF